MKKLMKTPKWLWILIGIVFVVSMAFIYFLLNYKIEETIETQVKTEGATRSIYIDSSAAYRVNVDNLVSLRVGDKTLKVYIENITFDDKLNLYKLDITGLQTNLLPHSTLKASIILGKHSVGSFLFGGV